MSREEIGNTEGIFTWDFGNQFFIETIKGNFVWSDPEYGGSNLLYETKLTYKEWINFDSGGYGRDKGIHIIKDYCKNFQYKE